MDKKYLVAGGYVKSGDGDEHYISASRVVMLYNINPDKCILMDERFPVRMYTKRDDLIVLRPRSDGNYRLPTENPIL